MITDSEFSLVAAVSQLENAGKHIAAGVSTYAFCVIQRELDALCPECINDDSFLHSCGIEPFEENNQ